VAKRRVPGEAFCRRKQIGLIAQEVEKVIPEVVSTDKADGYKSVEYSNMVAVLVEAVKELKVQNEVLQGKNGELTSRIEALENKN